MKTLVAYFSTEYGNTKKLAEGLAEKLSADLFEIQPLVPYSKKDVTYTNPLSRCNREFFGKKKVAVGALPENFRDYDSVLIGFPIWYGIAPILVHCFCDELDFTGKKVAAFATSGGSGIGKTVRKLAPHVKGTEVLDARRFESNETAAAAQWAKEILEK